MNFSVLKQTAAGKPEGSYLLLECSLSCISNYMYTVPGNVAVLLLIFNWLLHWITVLFSSGVAVNVREEVRFPKPGSPGSGTDSVSLAVNFP